MNAELLTAAVIVLTVLGFALGYVLGYQAGRATRGY